MSKEFNMRTDMLTDIDREELSRQVGEGYTSGRLDSEIDNGKMKYIYWEWEFDGELKVNVWEE